MEVGFVLTQLYKGRTYVKAWPVFSLHTAVEKKVKIKRKLEKKLLYIKTPAEDEV